MSSPPSEPSPGLSSLKLIQHAADAPADKSDLGVVDACVAVKQDSEVEKLEGEPAADRISKTSLNSQSITSTKMDSLPSQQDGAAIKKKQKSKKKKSKKLNSTDEGKNSRSSDSPELVHSKCPKADLDSALPSYYTSEDMYGKLWHECSEASAIDSCEHEKPRGPFAQLKASNFIRLGPCVIGYPASSWCKKGSESVTEELGNSRESATGEAGVKLDDATYQGPLKLRLWISNESHPTPDDFKDDIILKMLGVEEINRSDLMYPFRAYLNINGDIEYNLETGIQKEGICDFVDHFCKSYSGESNCDENFPSFKSIFEAIKSTAEPEESVDFHPKTPVSRIKKRKSKHRHFSSGLKNENFRRETDETSTHSSDQKSNVELQPSELKGPLIQEGREAVSNIEGNGCFERSKSSSKDASNNVEDLQGPSTDSSEPTDLKDNPFKMLVVGDTEKQGATCAELTDKICSKVDFELAKEEGLTSEGIPNDDNMPISRLELVEMFEKFIAKFSQDHSNLFSGCVDESSSENARAKRSESESSCGTSTDELYTTTVQSTSLSKDDDVSDDLESPIFPHDSKAEERTDPAAGSVEGRHALPDKLESATLQDVDVLDVASKVPCFPQTLTVSMTDDETVQVGDSDLADPGRDGNDLGVSKETEVPDGKYGTELESMKVFCAKTELSSLPRDGGVAENFEVLKVADDLKALNFVDDLEVLKVADGLEVLKVVDDFSTRKSENEVQEKRRESLKKEVLIGNSSDPKELISPNEYASIAESCEKMLVISDRIDLKVLNEPEDSKVSDVDGTLIREESDSTGSDCVRNKEDKITNGSTIQRQNDVRSSDAENTDSSKEIEVSRMADVSNDEGEALNDLEAPSDAGNDQDGIDSTDSSTSESESDSNDNDCSLDSGSGSKSDKDDSSSVSSIDPTIEAFDGLLDVSDDTCVLRPVKTALKSLPTSLKELGLQVVHPRAVHVVNRLAHIQDANWLPDNAERLSTVNINVISSAEEVGQTLMRALAETSRKRNKKQKYRQDKRKSVSSKEKQPGKKDKISPTSSKTAVAAPKELKSSDNPEEGGPKKTVKETSDLSKAFKPQETQENQAMPEIVRKVNAALEKSRDEISPGGVSPTESTDEHASKSTPDQPEKTIPALIGKLPEPSSSGLARHMPNKPFQGLQIPPKPQTSENAGPAAISQAARSGHSKSAATFNLQTSDHPKSTPISQSSGNLRSAATSQPQSSGQLQSTAMSQPQPLGHTKFAATSQPQTSGHPKSAPISQSQSSGNLRSAATSQPQSSGQPLSTATSKPQPLGRTKSTATSRPQTSRHPKSTVMGQQALGYFNPASTTQPHSSGYLKSTATSRPQSSEHIRSTVMHPVPTSAKPQTLGSAPASKPQTSGPPLMQNHAPPVGAIPTRSLPPAASLGAYPKPDWLTKPSTSTPQPPKNISKSPRDFGHLVTEAMSLMTPEQIHFAQNVILDVLQEGQCGTLCQFTRLSGLQGLQQNGKSADQLGQSHALERSNIGNSGVVFPTPIKSTMKSSFEPAKSKPSLNAQCANLHSQKMNSPSSNIYSGAPLFSSIDNALKPQHDTFRQRQPNPHQRNPGGSKVAVPSSLKTVHKGSERNDYFTNDGLYGSYKSNSVVSNRQTNSSNAAGAVPKTTPGRRNRYERGYRRHSSQSSNQTESTYRKSRWDQYDATPPHRTSSQARKQSRRAQRDQKRTYRSNYS